MHNSMRSLNTVLDWFWHRPSWVQWAMEAVLHMAWWPLSLEMFGEPPNFVTDLFVTFIFHYNVVENKINFLFHTFCVQYIYTNISVWQQHLLAESNVIFMVGTTGVSASKYILWKSLLQHRSFWLLFTLIYFSLLYIYSGMKWSCEDVDTCLHRVFWIQQKCMYSLKWDIVSMYCEH